MASTTAFRSRKGENYSQAGLLLWGVFYAYGGVTSKAFIHTEWYEGFLTWFMCGKWTTQSVFWTLCREESSTPEFTACLLLLHLLTLSKSFTIPPILFNISKYQKGNTFLLHGPWWADLVWMLSGVVGCQNISCLEHLFTDNTGMSHVKVNFGVPLNLWLIRHALATFQTGVSPSTLSLYHRLHHSVQL